MDMNTENKISPREKSEHGKSEANQDINKTKRNFFHDSLKRSEEKIRKKTCSTLRKRQENELDQKFDRSINLSPSVNLSYDLANKSKFPLFT